MTWSEYIIFYIYCSEFMTFNDKERLGQQCFLGLNKYALSPLARKLLLYYTKFAERW